VNLTGEVGIAEIPSRDLTDPKRRNSWSLVHSGENTSEKKIKNQSIELSCICSRKSNFDFTSTGKRCAIALEPVDVPARLSYLVWRIGTSCCRSWSSPVFQNERLDFPEYHRLKKWYPTFDGACSKSQ
jgi:hypothetical protein